MDNALPQQVILIVEDTPINIDIIGEILRSHYRLKVALSGEKALEICEQTPPDLILLDIMMPGMDGFEVCRQLKKNPQTAQIPVIFITVLNEQDDEAEGLALGAVDYITKPINPAILKARVKTHLALYDQNRLLEEKVQQRTKDLEYSRKDLLKTQQEVIRRLGQVAEYKDDATGNHILRVSHYSKLITLSAGLSFNEAEQIFRAAPLHDIGKVGITDQILLKPVRLTEEEWRMVQKHPTIGAEIIGEHTSELLQTARVIALTHHEKWDGSGYPQGLKGEAIPQCGRIVAIADVFDALTSRRVYKDAWHVERALNLIKNEKGRHFDPFFVKAFFEVVPEILNILEKYPDEIHEKAPTYPITPVKKNKNAAYVKRPKSP
ncbi:response regulator [Magnetococcales bacterium HHB-1]